MHFIGPEWLGSSGWPRPFAPAILSNARSVLSPSISNHFGQYVIGMVDVSDVFDAWFFMSWASTGARFTSTASAARSRPSPSCASPRQYNLKTP
ncbi:hypothetical protein CPLU01_01372 [Colletotrichum plurivorum]|uniref:Uncharacterized protein n=1 Tax=Colletotrichum plurivorum TaxID=2175906 RepID=A0A8H6NPA2_9PEZI|nr:hypothetical protein CPLU01_01372 [Colletotrichum plurivorum]